VRRCREQVIEVAKGIASDVVRIPTAYLGRIFEGKAPDVVARIVHETNKILRESGMNALLEFNAYGGIAETDKDF
jgi:predicted RecB family endonuclease